MAVETVPTRPIAGQMPGTSGLRKKTAVFREPGYLENYVQAVIDGVGGVAGHTIGVGGDGRFFNDGDRHHPAHARGEWRGQCHRGKGRHAVDACGLEPYPHAAPLAASSCRPAIIPAAKTAISV